MRNIQDVLREKEADIERLQREVKLLKVAARILEEEGQHPADGKARNAEAATSVFEEPLLEVVPVNATAPSNGEASSNKRWP